MPGQLHLRFLRTGAGLAAPQDGRVSSTMGRMLVAQEVATISIAAATLVVQVVLARTLGPDQYAIYSVAIAISTIALVVQGGGYRALLLRESVRATPGFAAQDQLYSGALGHVGVTSLILVTAAALLGFLSESPLTLPVVLALAANAPRIAALLLSAIILARGALVEEAHWQIVSRLVPLGATAVEALIGLGVTGVLLVLLVVQTAVMLLRPAQTPGWQPSLGFERATLTAALGLLLLDLMTQIYTRQAVIVLYGMGIPAAEIGRLGILMRIFEGYTLLLAPMALLFHNRARAHGLSSTTTLELGGAIVAVTGLLVAAGFAVFWFAGNEIIELVLGPEYISTQNLIPWFFVAALLVCPNLLLAQALISRNREWRYMLSAALMVPFNLGLNIWLIHVQGTAGVVLAMVITELALGALMLRQLLRN